MIMEKCLLTLSAMLIETNYTAAHYNKLVSFISTDDGSEVSTRLNMIILLHKTFVDVK